jgi:AraC-like DNA-binding protein
MPSFEFESFGLNARLLRPPKPMCRVHHHQEVELNFLFRGGVTYLHGGTLRRLEEGRLTLFWGSIPHSLVAVEPGSEMAWITVPLPWVWSWALPGGFLREIMDGKWLVAPAGHADRHPVRAWIAELEAAAGAHCVQVTLELQACMAWLAQHKSAASARPRQIAAGLTHVEKMARFMAERFTEPLTVSGIAAAADLHPNYAMPLFRRACGITLKDYLRQHRLQRAQQLLLTTDLKVLDIALASGFRSSSAFYDAFRRVVGRTPESFRRKVAPLL